MAAVSIATNAVGLALFAVVRTIWPNHTPDVRVLFEQGGDYAYPRLGYLLAWGGTVLLVSTALAFLIGAQPGFVGRFISRNYAPAIGYTSVWASAFEDGTDDSRVYLGIDLDDGSYLGGWLAWYSTEPDERPDRDLALAEPLTYRPSEDPEDRPLNGFGFVVVSARNIRRLYVSFVNELEGAGDGGDRRN